MVATDFAVPPAVRLTSVGEKDTVIPELLACPVRKMFPAKFWALVNETVVVPLAPGGTDIEVELTVRTKLPVAL